MPTFLSKPVCIVNPIAGRGRRARAIVEKALRAAGIDPILHETRAKGHGFELALQALETGATCVIAAGGDGTLNEVAGALVDNRVPLGVIPMGSGNAFARAWKISLNPSNACHQLVSSAILAMDVGVVEGHLFLSTAGLGLDAEVARRYAARTGKRRGLIPYVTQTLSALVACEPCPVRLIVDDRATSDCRPLLLVVANTANYGSGAVIAPGADPCDGLLSVRVFEPRNLWSLAINARRLFTRSIDRMPGVSGFEARSLRVERSEPGYLQCDGEAQLGPAHLQFGVKPGALHVLVPGS